MNDGHEVAEHPETSRNGQLGKNRHRSHQENREADGVGYDGTLPGIISPAADSMAAFSLLPNRSNSSKNLSGIDGVADGPRRN